MNKKVYLKINYSEENIISDSYYEYYKRHQSDLGHYFRNLYHIIKFVDSAEISNKKMYTSLVRAQLSSHELLLLFYNCLSTPGQKFKPFIEKYQLLKNMPSSDLIERSHKTMYNNSAYFK